MTVDKTNKAKIIKEFGINDNDTGSVQVQVALLNDKIRIISEHFEKNPKDVSSKRGLLKAVAERKSFLEYLKKHKNAEYKSLIQRLGLRK